MPDTSKFIAHICAAHICALSSLHIGRRRRRDVAKESFSYNYIFTTHDGFAISMMSLPFHLAYALKHTHTHDIDCIHMLLVHSYTYAQTRDIYDWPGLPPVFNKWLLHTLRAARSIDSNNCAILRNYGKYCALIAKVILWNIQHQLTSTDNVTTLRKIDLVGSCITHSDVGICNVRSCEIIIAWYCPQWKVSAIDETSDALDALSNHIYFLSS